MTDEDQQLTPFAGLRSLLTKPEVQNIWYNSRYVKLDGYTFRNCRFDNCDLDISSSFFEMHHCLISDNTRLSYKGEIVKILRLFNCRFEAAYEYMPQFCPERHEDGTISIYM